MELNTLGGADRVTLHDLSGTDLQRVQVNLAAGVAGLGGDGVADVVFVDGTAGADAVTITLENGAVVVRGLPAELIVQHFDAGIDRLVFNGLAGDDAECSRARPDPWPGAAFALGPESAALPQPKCSDDRQLSRHSPAHRQPLG